MPLSMVLSPLEVSGFVRFGGGQPGRGFRCTRTLSGSGVEGWQKYNNNNNITNFYIHRTNPDNGQEVSGIRTLREVCPGLSGWKKG
jgi:hypothetical protein